MGTGATVDTCLCKVWCNSLHCTCKGYVAAACVAAAVSVPERAWLAFPLAAAVGMACRGGLCSPVYCSQHRLAGPAAATFHSTAGAGTTCRGWGGDLPYTLVRIGMLVSVVAGMCKPTGTPAPLVKLAMVTRVGNRAGMS